MGGSLFLTRKKSLPAGLVLFILPRRIGMTSGGKGKADRPHAPYDH
jgi:hypothetical protein